MKRRIAIAVLAVAVTAATALPAQSEPAYKPHGKSSGRFQRLDASKLGKIVERSAVSGQGQSGGRARSSWRGAPVAVQQASEGRSFRRSAALRRVKASQDAAVPKLNAAVRPRTTTSPPC